MNLCQSKWDASSGWKLKSGSPAKDPQLVLVFGATALLSRTELLAEIQAQNPGALLFGCSTAGEISGAEVTDDSVVVTSIHFDHTKFRAVHVDLAEVAGSGAAAPSTSVGVAIVNFYGSSATNFLGTPNAWLLIQANGVNYKLPLYT